MKVAIDVNRKNSKDIDKRKYYKC